MAITLNGTTGITTPSLNNQGNLTVDGGASNVNLYLSNDSYSSYYYQNTGGSSGVTFPASVAYIWDAGGTERMRIDSVGRVTMPYQPAFRAGRNQGHTTAGNRIVFPNGYSNIGSNYNSTTGIFTAPVSGSYYFHAQLFTENNSSAQVQMRKNDAKHIWTIYSGGGYGNVSLSGVIELSTSDYVDVLVDVGSVYGGGSNSDCQFSGYLIG